MTNKITKVYKNGVEYDIYASGGAAGTGDVTGPSSSTDADIALFNGATGKIIKDSGKKLSDYQTALSTQTAYTSKGTSTKVPTITTNTLGQVTGITETSITYPSQVSDAAYSSSWNGVTGTAPSKNAVYDKINAMDIDVNTKTFYLSSTSDLTNAQAAYDWYAAGKNPIIVYGDAAYILYSVLSGQIIFRSTIMNITDYNDGYSSHSIRKLLFTVPLDTVTNIAVDYSTVPGDFLRTGKNYSTPYTPQYNGSPATKKYVDDSVSVVSGDSGVKYTIKVSNSDPSSGTASNIITLVL